MRIVQLTIETDAAMDLSQYDINDWQGRAAARTKKADEIKASLNAPVDLSSLSAVTYDAKTDRYTAKFVGGEKTLTLKVTDELAAFLAENTRKPGTWVGRMEGGALVDAYLITY